MSLKKLTDEERWRLASEIVQRLRSTAHPADRAVRLDVHVDEDTDANGEPTYRVVAHKADPS